MAKKSNKFILPESTIITVIARKGVDIYRQDMTYGEALKKKAENRDFNYTFYQLGNCYVKPNKFLKPKKNGK